MLNNLTNLFNLIKTRMVKTVLEDGDLFVVGTQDPKYDGGYKPTIAPLSAVVQAVISQLPPGLYGLFAQTVSSTPVAATTTEGSLIGTGLGSLSVPANGFAVGDSFRATFAGHISAHNNDTLRLRVKSGSVLLADTGAITMPGITNLHWTMWIDFTVRAIGPAGTAVITSGGQFTYMKNASNAFEGDAFSIVNNSTFNTTVLNTLSVTAQWSSNNASNSIYSELFNLYKTY
jgi:hypothetical protein